MNIKESYADAIDWLSKHEQNKILIRVKSEKELNKYQEYFKENIKQDLFLEVSLYDKIEWKIDSSL